MIRTTRTRDKILIITLTAYLGIALACGGRSGPEDNNDDNNTPSNNNTPNNNTPAGSELEGSYDSGLDLDNGTDSPTYTVKGRLDISGGDLIIPAGTTLEFEEGASIVIGAEAKIIANGTTNAPITLRGTSPNQGHWKGIRINSNSADNVFNFVTIEHAGSDKLDVFAEPTAILLANGKATIKNTTIRDSGGFAVDVWEDGELATFEDNTFGNNADGSVSITVNNIGQLDGSTSYNGVVKVVDGETSDDATWPALDSNYEVHEDLTIEKGAITIEAGADFVFTDSRRVVFSVDSSVIAIGTSEAPIKFRSADGVKGSWKGVRIDSKNSSNTFAYVSIADAGSDKLDVFTEKTNLFLADGKLKLRNSTFTNSAGFGLTQWEGADFGEFANNTFENNDVGSVLTQINNLGEFDNGSTYNDPVHLEDGETGDDATWPAIDTHYEVIEDLTVEEGAITIEAGADFVFTDSTRFVFGVDSSVIATGTGDRQIKMRGKTAESGFWKGVRIDSKNANNAFDHVVIEHGGSDKLDVFAEPTNLLLANGRMTLTNSIMRESDGFGFVQWEDGALINFVTNTFEDNGVGSVHTRAQNIGQLDAASTYNQPVVIGDSSTVTDSQTWPAIDSYYKLDQDISFSAGTLTVSPGVKVWCTSNRKISFTEDAIIIAEGTEAEPIVFRGTTAAPGFWKGILFQTKSTESRLDYVELSHTGSDKLDVFVEKAAIALDNANLRVKNTTVTDVDGFGLYATDDSNFTDEGGNDFGPEGVGYEAN